MWKWEEFFIALSRGKNIRGTAQSVAHQWGGFSWGRSDFAHARWRWAEHDKHTRESASSRATFAFLIGPSEYLAKHGCQDKYTAAVLRCLVRQFWPVTCQPASLAVKSETEARDNQMDTASVNKLDRQSESRRIKSSDMREILIRALWLKNNKWLGRKNNVGARKRADSWRFNIHFWSCTFNFWTRACW